MRSHILGGVLYHIILLISCLSAKNLSMSKWKFLVEFSNFPHPDHEKRKKRIEINKGTEDI